MTTVEREQIIVASIFDHPTGRFGESLCTALAHWEWWESVEAKLVAAVIRECLDNQRVPSRSMVGALLPHEQRQWVRHPMFGPDNALSLELADYEASSLLPIYRNKRITAIIGKAYQKCLDKPEAAKEALFDLQFLQQDYDRHPNPK